MSMGESHPGIALLTPVPLVHLLDGLEVCEAEGKVAFGSNAWELFEDLDRTREGMPVDVFIYASRSPEPLGNVASWTARYVGYIRRENASAQAIPRPPSTAEEDAEHYWAGYWLAIDLRRLPPDEHVTISGLRGSEKQRYFQSNFIPEGPLTIDRF